MKLIYIVGMDQGRVANSGGVDLVPTFKTNPDPNPNLKKDPDPQRKERKIKKTGYNVGLKTCLFI